MAKKKRQAKAVSDDKKVGDNGDIAIARARGMRIHWHAPFLKSLRRDMRVQNACAAVGKSRQCAYEHKKIYPGFAGEWEEIIEGWTDNLESACYQRAVDGVEEKHFDKEGDLAFTVVKYSDRLAEFMLRGRRRGIYGDKIAVSTSTASPLSAEEEAAAHNDAIKNITATIRAAAMRGIPAKVPKESEVE